MCYYYSYAVISATSKSMEFTVKFGKKITITAILIGLLGPLSLFLSFKCASATSGESDPAPCKEKAHIINTLTLDQDRSKASHIEFEPDGGGGSVVAYYDNGKAVVETIMCEKTSGATSITSLQLKVVAANQRTDHYRSNYYRALLVAGVLTVTLALSTAMQIAANRSLTS